MEKPFNTKQLTPMDKIVRQVADEQYDLCIFDCNKRNEGGHSVCKN